MSTLGDSTKKQMGAGHKPFEFVLSLKKCLPNLGVPLFMQPTLLSSTQFLSGKTCFTGRHKTNSCLCEICSSPSHSMGTEGGLLPLGCCSLGLNCRLSRNQDGSSDADFRVTKQACWYVQPLDPCASICPSPICLARVAHCKVH